MNGKERVRYVANLGIFTALVVALGFASNYITIGIVNINLALFVVVLGACLLGPVAGLWLGFVDGVMCLVAPPTLAAFMPVNPLMTVLLCLLKTGLAGFICGIVFDAFKSLKKDRIYLGIVIVSLLVPIINTGIFIGGTLLFFMDVYGNDVVNLLTTTMLINFVIEVAVTIALSGITYRLIKLFKSKYSK